MTERDKNVAKIEQALKFIRNDSFEVPFIAFYRKEYVEPELTIVDLWKIYNFDEKVRKLERKASTGFALIFSKYVLIQLR